MWVYNPLVCKVGFDEKKSAKAAATFDKRFTAKV